MPRSGLKPAGIAGASSGSRLSRSGHAGGFCSSDPAFRYRRQHSLCQRHGDL